MKLNLYGNMPVYLPRDPEGAMEAATKNYVDRVNREHEQKQELHLSQAQHQWISAITVTAEEINSISGIGENLGQTLQGKLDLAGGTMTGALYLHANPVDPNQAATKSYVDAQDELKVSKAGDTVSGHLILSAYPTNALHAAPKKYVDACVATHTDNADLHVPANKVDFLKNVVATATEVNTLMGVTDNVQTQIDSKVAKAGDIMTGPLVLSGIPTADAQAANKQYVDQQDAQRVAKSGDTMTGPLVLSGVPTADAQAANKQYVDATVVAHAVDQNLHLSPDQKTLLNGLTVTAEDINKIGGLTDSVSALLETKFDKAGGTVTGDITLADGKTVFVNKTPVADSELVNKAYVDAKVESKEWRDPVTLINLISTVESTPPTNPVEDDAYIVGAAATGAWADKEGYAVVFTKGEWKFVQERAVAVGDRFGVALRSQTAVGDDIAAYSQTLVTVTDATVGAMAFAEDVITAGATTLVFNKEAPDFGVTYTFNDEGYWVPTNTSVNLTAGAALELDGSMLNVRIARGLTLDANNALEVSVASGAALELTQSGQIDTVVDGTTVVKTGGQLAVAPAVMDKVDDAVLKAQAAVVTGGVTFAAGAVAKVVTAPVATDDIANKQYVDGADQALRSDVQALQQTVGELNTDPVTKTYVDTEDGKKLNKAGGTMTGALTLHADPSSALHAATKNYVDTELNTHATNDSLHLTASQNELLDSLQVSAAEINHLDGVASNVQTQLNDRLPLAGGTMSGPITLAGEPAANAHAANKAYVDNQVQTRLPLAGGVMNGPITLAGDPTAALHAVTKQYADSNLSAHVQNDAVHLTPDQNAFLDAVTVSAEEVNHLEGVSSNVQDQLTAKVNKAGDTMTGALTLSGAPTADLHAATKQYVDSNTTNKLPLAGGTMTGSLILSGAPVAAAEAATKSYVDQAITDNASSINAEVNNRVAKAGDTMTGFLTLHAAPTAEMHAATKKFVEDTVSDSAIAIGAQITTTNQNVATLRSDVNTLMADPVTKNYVDTKDAARVSKAGDTMTGFLTLHADPQSPMHAVPKQYVDAVAQGLKTKPAVRLASTVNIAGTYNNGTAGVNATLTAAANGALSVDGVTPIVGDRILLRMQTNAAENGDYVVQQVGNGSTPAILKRVETADESAEIPGAYFYTYDGQTLKGTGWTLVVVDPVTFSIGNDPIVVNQFSGQGSIIAGDGMILTGNTLDIKAADPTRITVTADAIDLTPTGVTPGAYTKVTVDGFGRVTTATNPTTLAGYGINDAQPLNTTLTNLAQLASTGIVVLDAAGQAQTRKVVVGGVGLTVANANGGTGNITITSNATAAATAGTVVARDASGNFSANVITAALTGNASSATVLKDSRNFSITGDVVATPEAFNGSDNVVLTSELSPTGVTAGTYTKVTVDAKGRITLGENPDTLAGHGIIDGATIDYVNQKIAELEERMDQLHLYVMSRL